MSLSLTTGGLSKKPGQVCDSGVNLLPNNKGLVGAHLKRRQGVVCMQREDDVLFLSQPLFFLCNPIFHDCISHCCILSTVYRTVYFLTKLCRHFLFVILRKAVFFHMVARSGLTVT